MKSRITLCLMLTLCCAPAATQPASPPVGWAVRGTTNDYEVTVDRAVFSQGKQSVCLKSKVPAPRNFINLLQPLRADDYRSKRVRLSAQVKVQGTAPETQLWMRIDTATRYSVSFDNMADRIIRPFAEWRKYEIVLDVPADALNITFGVTLAGNGQAWVDDFQLEPVSASTPVTKPLNPVPAARKSEPVAQRKPVNLDFEKG